MHIPVKMYIIHIYRSYKVASNLYITIIIYSNYSVVLMCSLYSNIIIDSNNFSYITGFPCMHVTVNMYIIHIHRSYKVVPSLYLISQQLHLRNKIKVLWDSYNLILYRLCTVYIYVLYTIQCISYCIIVGFSLRWNHV